MKDIVLTFVLKTRGQEPWILMNGLTPVSQQQPVVWNGLLLRAKYGYYPVLARNSVAEDLAKRGLRDIQSVTCRLTPVSYPEYVLELIKVRREAPHG